MTTDNRTSEPTPEQVEVAAVASINSHRSRFGLPTLATLDGVPNADEWRDDARAALVAAARAAQGVAPQAECNCGAGPGSAVCKKVCATRSPARGHAPSHDREQLIRQALESVREIGESGLAGEPLSSIPKDVDSDWGWLQTMWPVAIAVDIALASRAAVPDAATGAPERALLLSECVKADAGMHKWVRVPVKTIRAALASPDAATDRQVIIPIARIHELRAAKDAALAAIERCREVTDALRSRYAENSDAAYFVHQIVAALDGAPKPEWEERTIYGAQLESGHITIEVRGPNYSTHKRTVRYGPWMPVGSEGEEA